MVANVKVTTTTLVTVEMDEDVAEALAYVLATLSSTYNGGRMVSVIEDEHCGTGIDFSILNTLSYELSNRE